jgi:hypothetical protein
MGSVVVQLMSPQNSGKAGSYLRQAWRVAKDDAKRTAAIVTAPDKGERLQRFAYNQLPSIQRNSTRALHMPSNLRSLSSFQYSQTFPLRQHSRLNLERKQTCVHT